MSIPVIEQAKIQAQVLVPLIKAMQAELGEARANALVRKALGEIYRRYGEEFWRAKREENLGNSLASAFAQFRLYGSAAVNGSSPPITEHAPGSKGKLVGTWKQVVSEVATSDGKRSFPFGELPNGILIFTENGHFVQVHIASGIPKFLSNSRPTGTADENKAVVQGSIALFGTYSVDEAKRKSSLTLSRPAPFPIGTSGSAADDRPLNRDRVCERQPWGFHRGRCRIAKQVHASTFLDTPNRTFRARGTPESAETREIARLPAWPEAHVRSAEDRSRIAERMTAFGRLGPRAG